jgi:hypothetical protein
MFKKKNMITITNHIKTQYILHHLMLQMIHELQINPKFQKTQS